VSRRAVRGADDAARDGSRGGSRRRARAGSVTDDGDGARRNAVGRADPDSRARTHLANERTFLAWLRTGLGLIVLGLAAAQFIEIDRGLIPGWRAVTDFSAVLIVSGGAIALVGAVRYFRGRDEIEAARFRPAGRGIVAAAALAILIAVLSLLLVYLLGR
jgi:putative membrane protein